MTKDTDSKIEFVDKAGQSILDLLDKAVHATDQNSRQVVETAQRLSQQLQAARDRIAQLEHERNAQRDRAERTEAWLNKIHSEIEKQFSERAPKR